ncbi:hypothetical protein N7510_006597 [Penicillium lagena]|uniref:uncharacterized protein n=1 Tax=Penicillium lagena TaxID=94218 RepID=UPI0025404919|nr:uncharacterized protein N7510_006597 [Penicillium lagena]KAJ5613403.1 hypothetical protein N7510_006597 [Penicillium lagena]
MFLRLLTSALLFSTISNAQFTPVGLGTAGNFLVLAATTVTNTNTDTIVDGGDLGVSPGNAVTNFPPGEVIGGTIHAGDAVAAQAQLDLATAYGDAAGQAPTATLQNPELGGLTLFAGTYKAGSTTTFGITGTLTLDGQGDPDSVWIFQMGTTLITASSSRVVLTNGAQACNVFWQVGSSATLGTGSTFVGTIMALTSITATTNVAIQGRLLALNAAVTLDDNKITVPGCSTTSTTTTSTTTTSTTTTSTTTTTQPIITLPVIGPIGPIVIPILPGGIGNDQGSGGNGNGHGSGGNGNGNGNGNDNDNDNGNGNGNGNGIPGDIVGSILGDKDNEIWNGNGGPSPAGGIPYSVNQHSHHHDQGHGHYGPYDDHYGGSNGDHYGGSNNDNYGDHYGGSNNDNYGDWSTGSTTKPWEPSMTESAPFQPETYNPSWSTEPIRGR